jgi:hypothetical protein
VARKPPSEVLARDVQGRSPAEVRDELDLTRSDEHVDVPGFAQFCVYVAATSAAPPCSSDDATSVDRSVGVDIRDG